MSKQHSEIRPHGRHLHFLEELEAIADAAETRLETATRRRDSIRALHERMIAKAKRDGLPTARLEAQRDGLMAEEDLDSLEAAHVEALHHHQQAFEVFLTANRYSLARVIRHELIPVLLGEGVRPTPEQRAALADLAAALRDYLWDYPSDDADRRIRASWKRIEAA